MLCQILNTRLVRDVQVVVLDLCEAAVRLESFRLLQLRVLLELLQRGLASALVASRKVDKEGTIVQRRLGVLKSQLADNREANSLLMLAGLVDTLSVGTLLAPVTTPILL